MDHPPEAWTKIGEEVTAVGVTVLMVVMEEEEEEEEEVQGRHMGLAITATVGIIQVILLF